MCTRGGPEAFATTSIVGVCKQTDGEILQAVAYPPNHLVMLGVMNVTDQMEKPGVLFNGPLSDLTSKVIDGAKQVKTAYARGVEQLHQYARSMWSQSPAIDVCDFLFLGRLRNRRRRNKPTIRVIRHCVSAPCAPMGRAPRCGCPRRMMFRLLRQTRSSYFPQFTRSNPVMSVYFLTVISK